MGNPLVIISVKISIIGPLSAQIRTLKSVVWSMKLYAKIVVTNTIRVLQKLLSETWSSTVLDSGASSTVCGAQWFHEHTEGRSAQDKSKVTYEDFSKPFRFGDGKKFLASKVATIPANIGPHKVGIKTHIVNTDIPLLLSKSAMKK